MVKLEDRKALIERARYLMNNYGYDVLFALRIAEQEIKEQLKNEGEE